MSSEDPCHILVRSKAGLEIFATPERSSDPIPTKAQWLLKGYSTFMKCSPDGSHAYVHLNNHGIVRVALKGATSETVSKENSPPFFADTSPVQMMDISPKGTYVLTWERWYEDKPNNMKLWLSATGELITSFTQKALKREGWPYLQFAPDEAFAFLMASGEVRVYTPESLKEQKYMDKLRISGITTLSVPRNGTGYTFTSFCLGTKDKPARASLHEYLPGKTAPGQYPALLSKSLFQTEECKTHWSPSGETALITMQTSVDTSGESYYGSSQLFILAKHLPQAEAVPLEHGGPVYSVSWMPNPDKPPCFVVIGGKMPSLATMHDGRDGKPTFQFGNAHRNVVDWAPHGRFLNIGGFGNLGGGMGFWDRNKLKLIPGCAANVEGFLRADAVVGHGWSPDSRLFCVSTCTPRMNVDNGLRLFRYNGEELLNVPWKNDDYRPDKLLEACFVPALPTVYPDRPQTPVKDSGGSAASAPTATVPAPKPAGRYVPPSARRGGGTVGGRGGGSSLAERLRREKEGNLQKSGKVAEKPSLVKSAITGKSIPGMSTEPTTKSKSQIKREKAKLKAAQKEEAERKLREQEALLKAQTTEPEVAVDPEKRARKLKKTLKQIEELKKKDAGELNDDQKAKLASESQLREELSKLE